MTQTVFTTTIRTVTRGVVGVRDDQLAVEEPLEIRLGFGPAHSRSRRTAAVTMRTPGQDLELAVGYLFAEGVIRTPSDVVSVEQISTNTVRVELHPAVAVDPDRLSRTGVMASSCGLCGKTSIDALEPLCDVVSSRLTVAPEVVHRLPERLRACQPTFGATGGLHAVGLFAATGDLLAVREDVGRHNAMDKLIGRRLFDAQLPANDAVVLISARASFELVQKAAMAGVPVLAAVGSASSLAVQTAERFGVTLLGFVRDERFNIYSHPDRIGPPRVTDSPN